MVWMIKLYVKIKEKLSTFFGSAGIRIKKILLNPFVGAIIAASAVLAGGIVSIFAKEIHNWYPFTKNGEFSYWAIAFWLLLLFFVFSTTFRQWFRDVDAKNNQEIFVNTIQSLPPSQFALEYRIEFSKVNKAYNGIKDYHAYYEEELSNKKKWGKRELQNFEDDIQFIEQRIRFILDSYVYLARFWDSPESFITKDIVYRANIMSYYPVDEIPEGIRSNLYNMQHFFVEKNLPALLYSVDGILVLADNTLTTTTATRDPDPDSEIRPICFSVTFKEGDNKRMQNIPGAPKAIVYEQAQWIKDTNEIYELCDNSNKFTPDSLERIKHYYNRENKANSILAIPLVFHIESEDKRIGVLNIYANRKEIFRSNVRSEQFNSFMTPFNSLLCSVLVCAARINQIYLEVKN